MWYSDLLNKQWRCFRVSPLFGMDFELTKLKDLSNTLRTFIRNEMGIIAGSGAGFGPGAIVGWSDVTDSEEMVTCSVRYAPVFRGERMLEFSLSLNGADEAAQEMRLVAKLFSRKASQNTAISREGDRGGFVSFPLQLVRGHQKLVAAFNRWLEKRFDCSTTPLVMPSHDLSSIFVEWIKLHWNTQKPIELTYALPPAVRGLRRISVTIPAAEVRHVSRKIIESREFSESVHANLFFQGIADHFRHVFSINLHALSLVGFGTAVAAFTKEGRIKLLSEEYAGDVLYDLLSVSDVPSAASVSTNVAMTASVGPNLY